jgi:tetratricopeptide (TPR) repeat protein
MVVSRVASLLALVLIIGSAHAAEPALTPAPDVTGPRAGDPPPGAKSDAASASDELLNRLAKTEDPAAAKRIAAALRAVWTRSGSDTVDLLTARAMEAQRKAKRDVALKLLDAVVTLKPDYAEGWNQRATLHFLGKDYDRAMADIHETLLREPRHFGAWAGLARILRDAGLDRQALAAFRKALEIYPAIDGLQREVDELTVEVEGRPI